MTKQMDDVLEFLRSFIAGGSQQDFKPWASELYQKLYRASDEPNGKPVPKTEWQEAMDLLREWGQPYTEADQSRAPYGYRIREFLERVGENREAPR